MSRIIAIAGGSAAGKSTLAGALCRALAPGAAVVEQDAYYRDLGAMPEPDRAANNFDLPSALELDRLAADLTALRAGRAAAVPRYDFTRHARLPGSDPVPARPFIVAAGLHLLATPGIRAQCDLAVFLEVPSALRLARRVARDTAERGRDPAEARARFETQAEPAFQEIAADCRAAADLVLRGDAPLGDSVEAVLDALRARGWLPPGAGGHNSPPEA